MRAITKGFAGLLCCTMLVAGCFGTTIDGTRGSYRQLTIEDSKDPVVAALHDY